MEEFIKWFAMVLIALGCIAALFIPGEWKREENEFEDRYLDGKKSTRSTRYRY